MPSFPRPLAALALVAIASTLACGAERVPVAPFEAFSYAFTDAEGDTLANAATLPQRALDVTGISGSVDASSIVVELRFSTPVRPWSEQATGSVDGFVDMDIDNDAATGIPGAAAEFGGSAPLGAEYYLSLRDEIGPGRSVGLVRVADYSFRPVAATWEGNVMRVTIPRAAMQDDDGTMRLSVVVGHPQDPATDFAPSSGYYVVER